MSFDTITQKVYTDDDIVTLTEAPGRLTSTNAAEFKAGMFWETPERAAWRYMDTGEWVNPSAAGSSNKPNGTIVTHAQYSDGDGVLFPEVGRMRDVDENGERRLVYRNTFARGAAWLKYEPDRAYAEPKALNVAATQAFKSLGAAKILHDLGSENDEESLHEVRQHLAGRLEAALSDLDEVPYGGKCQVMCMDPVDYEVLDKKSTIKAVLPSTGTYGAAYHVDRYDRPMFSFNANATVSAPSHFRQLRIPAKGRTSSLNADDVPPAVVVDIKADEDTGTTVDTSLYLPLTARGINAVPVWLAAMFSEALLSCVDADNRARLDRAVKIAQKAYEEYESRCETGCPDELDTHISRRYPCTTSQYKSIALQSFVATSLEAEMKAIFDKMTADAPIGRGALRPSISTSARLSGRQRMEVQRTGLFDVNHLSSPRQDDASAQIRLSIERSVEQARRLEYNVRAREVMAAEYATRQQQADPEGGMADSPPAYTARVDEEASGTDRPNTLGAQATSERDDDGDDQEEEFFDSVESLSG